MKNKLKIDATRANFSKNIKNLEDFFEETETKAISDDEDKNAVDPALKFDGKRQIRDFREAQIPPSLLGNSEKTPF